jgi:hypothetical protein
MFMSSPTLSTFERSSCAKYSSSRAVLSSTNVERIHASNASTFLLIALARAYPPRGPTSRHVSISPFPFTSTSPIGSVTKSSRRSAQVERVI